MTGKTNLVFMGGFTYPGGMAGTKRIQNAVNALKQFPDVAVQVMLLRQSGAQGTLSGVHEGTPYQTVMGEVLRGRLLTALPALYRRAMARLKEAFRPDRTNIIYFYGVLFIDSVVPLMYARRLGYKIVFDVIEDYDLTRDVSRSLYGDLKGALGSFLSSRINALASGIIVISSHLEQKYRASTGGRLPVLYLPISVDLKRFPPRPAGGAPATLFYAGSFGKKDGLPVLFDAFDKLAARYRELRLVLTGKGENAEALREFQLRVEASPYRERIVYKGYLSEDDYYGLLNETGIPCMTRVDLAYANAGFPFKLGEFLASGNPVVASRVSDVERFLVHGRDAMLVAAGSSDELCAAVQYLIEHPRSAAEMGARGRAAAEAFFDHEQQGRALAGFFARL